MLAPGAGRHILARGGAKRTDQPCACSSSPPCRVIADLHSRYDIEQITGLADGR